MSSSIDLQKDDLELNATAESTVEKIKIGVRITASAKNLYCLTNTIIGLKSLVYE